MAISEAFYIDCIEYMKTIPDKFFDLAPADPNYGRKEDGGVNRSGYVKQKNGSKIFTKSTQHKKKNWDQKPAGEEFFNELFRVSKNQIIWGCNYYDKNFGPGRIIWDKCNEGSDQSDCEVAYNSLTDKVDLFNSICSYRLVFSFSNVFKGKMGLFNIIYNNDVTGNFSIIYVLLFWRKKTTSDYFLLIFAGIVTLSYSIFQFFKYKDEY